ncbi:hypothetical protein Tco_0748678 [Tanacetum coccineum]|uniref:Reverse transcriptase Ty1/copia-type domain-containing protein n=1 Tax=Tanacetum coccineum TaxID=301880 RepID=A0ABQ4YZA1_9ASTR
MLGASVWMISFLVSTTSLQVKQHKGGIFISQDKYVAEILKKFDLVNVKAAITPMETKMPLTKDEEAFDVDVHLYRSMIGSLMYLTASRPDIMYAVCVCSRFQVTPKTSHLNVVMRDLHGIHKGKPNLGLWYPRESPFDLEAFSDSDYGGSNLDRKSTTGGCQFLGQRLISWQCKKQTIVATSTTEAEYVAAANCCGQATIDTISYTVSEASIRDSLQLEDATGITMLPNDELFEGMGQIGSKSGGWDQFGSNIATALICLSTGQEHAVVAQSQSSSSTPQLVKKVKKLEGFLKRRNMVLSDSEEEEPEAQGRKSQDDPLDSSQQGLVTPSTTKVKASGEEQVEDISPNTLEAAKTLSKVASLKPSLDFQEEEVDTGAEQVNTAEGVSTGSTKLSTGNEQVSIVGDKKSTSSTDKGQRAGKAPMIIEETPKKSKEQVLQEEASLAEAIRLVTLQKEEVAKQVHLDSLLAQRIAEEEELNEQQMKRKAQVQFELAITQMKTGFNLEQRLKLMQSVRNILQKRARAKETRPDPIKLKDYMMNYLKKCRDMESLQTKTSKRLKDDEEVEAQDDEPPEVWRKRRKQMARKGLHTSVDKDDSEGSDEDSEQDDSVTGTKTPINPVPVAMKTPSIATYKIFKQGEKGAYQIVREDGTDVVYINFGAMLKVISRDDLTELYRIVMNRYGMDGPEDELEKVFWKYLKNMFEEPLSTDPIWSELGQQRIISWRYYESCRVHCLNLESMDIYMLIERTYPLSAEMCKVMLDKKLQGGKPDENCYKMLKMMEKKAGIRK